MTIFAHIVSPVYAPDDGTGAAPAPSGAPTGSDSGGTPSPSSTPSGADPSVPGTVGDGGTKSPPVTRGMPADDVDDDPAFNDFGAVFDALSTSVATPVPQLVIPGAEGVAPAPAAAQTSAPVVPPSGTTAVPPAAPIPQPATTTAPQTGVQPAPTSPGQQGQSPPVNLADPVQFLQSLEVNRAQLSEAVASQLYQLSAEDAEAFATDPGSVLPKLAANLHMNVLQAAVKQISAMVPHLISQHGTLTREHDQNMGKFYARWPDIKMDQHGGVVNRAAQMYRAMNPQTTLDQMIEDIGPMVLMMAKIAPSAARPGQQQQQPQGVPGVRPPPASPFVPAMSSPAAPHAQSNGQDDPWGGLGQHFNE